MERPIKKAFAKNFKLKFRPMSYLGNKIFSIHFFACPKKRIKERTLLCRNFHSVALRETDIETWPFRFQRNEYHPSFLYLFFKEESQPKTFFNN